jgi:hypothetical protein
LLSGVLLTVCFMFVSCFAYSWALKMEEICSSETSVDIHRTAQRHITDDSENLRLFEHTYCSVYGGL